MIGNIYKSFFFLFFSWIAIVQVISQSYLSDKYLPQPKIKTYTTEDGLSQLIIRSITQDTLGFLWIGSEDGLNRFDGHEFRVFYSDGEIPNSLPDNFIYSLHSSKNGSLWIGTNNAGISRYLPEKEHFIRYNHPDDSLNILNAGRIYCLHEGYDSSLWIGTYNNGLHRFNPSKNTFQYYPFLIKENHHVNKSIYSIVADSSGNIWVKTSIGLGNINLNTGKISHVEIGNEILNADNIGTLIIDDNNTLWTNHQSGLASYTPETEKIAIYDIRNELNENIEIIEITQKDKDQLWLSGYTGFYQFDKNDFTVTKYGGEQNSEMNRAYNSILSMYRDKEDNLWLGGASNGLSMLNTSSNSFYHIRTLDYDKKSIRTNIIRSIMVDSENNLWVGQVTGNLDILYSNGQISSYTTTTQNTSESIEGFATSITETSQNEVWVATWGNGILIYDKTQNGEFQQKEQLLLPKQSSPIILSLYEDKQKNMWIGTETGLVIYNPFSKSFRLISNNPDSRNSITPYGVQSNCIVKDVHGNTWIGTWGGLTKMRPLLPNENSFDCTYDFEQFTNDSTISFSLADQRIISLYYNQELFPDLLFAGTYGGGLVQLKLNAENGEVESLKTFDKKNGLSNDVIFGIEGDNNSTLWLSTSHGINRLEPNSGRIWVYKESDGLQSDQFYWGAVASGNTGELYFGGVNGISVINPQGIIDEGTPPRIVFTDLKVLGKSISVGETINKRIILDKGLNFTDRLRFSYKEKVFTIGFTGLFFKNADKIQYKYVLENFEENWNFVNHNERIATYTNLPSGNYTFKVSGANVDGKWSDPITLKIKVTPPFWKSLLFRISVTLFIVFLFFQYFRIRTKRIVFQNLQLEEKVRERTEELQTINEQLIIQSDEMTEINIDLEERQMQIEQQSKELKAQHDELQKINNIKDKLFSILAHDLKNPLNNAKGYIDLLLHRYETYDDTKKKGIIDSLNKSVDSIYELLMNLLNWSNAQQGAILYDPKPCIVDDVITENIQFIRPIAKEKEISIFFNSISKEIKALIDRNLIDSVIRNLMHNAVKYSFNGGEIFINVLTDNEYIEISILDYGIGISEKALKNLFDKEKIESTKGTNNEPGTGLGLIICKELIEIHGGEIWVESFAGSGTKFTFSLKKV